MESLLETFNESSAQLQALYDRANCMDDGGNECKIKVDVLRALHDCFESHTAKMSYEMDSIRNREELEAEEIEAEVAALEAEVQILTKISDGCDFGGHPLPKPTIHSPDAYRSFATQLADFAAQLSVLRGALQNILSQASLQVVNVPLLITWCSVSSKAAWEARQQQIHVSLKSLQGSAVRAGISLSESSLILAHDLFNEVVLLGKKAVSHVADGLAAQEEQEDAMKQVESKQHRLVVWCRQQQANLDVLNDPDHIQEFCASLLEHYRVMLRNFHALLEKAEPFLDHKMMQEWLLEANEAWVQLHVKTLERLRHTLFEVHADTLLEDHVKELSSSCRQVAPFLNELESSLEATRDTASSLKQRCLQLYEDCKKMWQMIPDNEDLCKQLLYFAERMQMEREAYNCYRVATLSRAAYLASSSDVLAEVERRKEEYKSCEEELQVWAEQKSRSDTWRDIRDKVRSMKTLLEQELQVVGGDTTSL